jgi:hypothetical protein
LAFKMSNPLPQKNPRRRWRRLALIPLVPVLAFAGLFAFDWYQGHRAWREACAEADRLDPGWRWEDLLARRPELPADRDAIRVTQAAASKLPEKWPDWGAAIPEENLPPLAGQARDKTEDPHLPGDPARDILLHQRRQAAAEQMEVNIGALSRNHRPTTAMMRSLRGIMAQSAQAVDQARQLADLPAGRPEDGGRPILLNLSMVSAMRSRQVATLLQMHALLAAEDGRPDEALHDARAMLAAARAAAEPPMLINGLMAMAVRHVTAASIERTLAQGEPGPAALLATQRDVETGRDDDLWLRSLRGERATQEDLVRAIDEGRVTQQQRDEMDTWDVSPVTGWPTIDRWIDRMRGGGYRKQHVAETVRYYTAIIELVKESPDAPKRKPDALAAILNSRSPAVAKWLETVDQMIVADRRQRAILSTVAAALAVERFRRDGGRWPASFAEMVPGYLKNVPIDPFDLQPLRYKHLPDGVVIYAVGPDGVDDGGAVHTPAPGPLAVDIGVRLWDVAHRRQPPKPADDGMKKP